MFLQRTLTVSFSFLLLCSGLFSEAADDRTADATQAEARLRPILTDWQKAQWTTLDPRMLRELAGEFVHARTIFTHGEQPGSKRLRQFADDDWLAWIVEAYLSDLASSPRMVKTLFAGLGEGVGLDPERSGWPSTKVNSYMLRDFSGDLPHGSFLLTSDNLPSDDGYLANRKFIVGPGSHVILAKDGSNWSFDVEVPAPAATPSRESNPRSARGQSRRDR